MTILTRYAVEPSKIILGWFRIMDGAQTVATVCSEALARRMVRLLNSERPAAPRPGEEVADGG